MPRIPDIGVFSIYASLIIIYGLFSWWLFGVWRKVSGSVRSLLLALMFLAVMMAIDNVVWIFGSMAYAKPIVPAIRQFIIIWNVWAFEKVLWGIAGLLVWWSLRANGRGR